MQASYLTSPISHNLEQKPNADDLHPPQDNSQKNLMIDSIDVIQAKMQRFNSVKTGNTAEVAAAMHNSLNNHMASHLRSQIDYDTVSA
jgi:hypothetical protein